MKGRSEEWWKIKLHSTALFGFFVGGLAGFMAYEARGIHLSFSVWTCGWVYGARRGGGDGMATFSSSLTTSPTHQNKNKKQKFEHAALLINISVTAMCAIIHTVYGTHPHMQSTRTGLGRH